LQKCSTVFDNFLQLVLVLHLRVLLTCSEFEIYLFIYFFYGVLDLESKNNMFFEGVDAQKSPGARCRLVIGWRWIKLVLVGC
jgi:hypothetical protein